VEHKLLPGSYAQNLGILPGKDTESMLGRIKAKVKQEPDNRTDNKTNAVL